MLRSLIFACCVNSFFPICSVWSDILPAVDAAVAVFQVVYLPFQRPSLGAFTIFTCPYRSIFGILLSAILTTCPSSEAKLWRVGSRCEGARTFPGTQGLTLCFSTWYCSVMANVVIGGPGLTAVDLGLLFSSVPTTSCILAYADEAALTVGNPASSSCSSWPWGSVCECCGVL